MKIVCGITARNEDWCLGFTARAALMWCDELIVLDHCSTDSTAEIVRGIDRASVIKAADPVFHPLRFYAQLMEAAISRGATHMAMLDADELISANLVGSIRQHVEALPHDGSVLDMPWIPVMPDFAVDTVSNRAHLRTGIVWQLAPGLTYQHVTDQEYDIHRSRLPVNRGPLVPMVHSIDDGGLLHLQYLDNRRLRAKQVLWKMMEMTRWPGRAVQSINAYYDCSVHDLSPSKLIPDNWLYLYGDLLQYLHLGEESAAEKEIKALWQQDSSRFVGINTLGLDLNA